jgi:hypothetical protein
MLNTALIYHTQEEHFDTPEYAIKSLIPYLPKDKIIWECTDTYGKSGIVTGLHKAGYSVEASNFDFLTSNASGFDIIVTNPPFNKKDQFLAKCINYNCPFALLLPLTSLEGKRRHLLWKEIEDDFGLLVHDSRISFIGGGNWLNTSWFTYKLFKGIKFCKLEEDDE